jgi:hypothetical protein
MSRWVQAELHCHTTASHDGLVSPRRLLRKCRERGVDIIAVTDHDTIDGALEAKRLASEGDPKVIVGEERTLANGVHIIGLFLESKLSSDNFPELLDEIKTQGGLCVVPHPFRPKDGLLAKTPEFRQLALKENCLLEVHNPKASFVQNEAAFQEMQAHGWMATVGSDAHYESDVAETLNSCLWRGDVRGTLDASLFGGPLRLTRKPQHPARDVKGRQYASLYYKLRGPLRLPGFLKPIAKQSYHHWRNFRSKPPQRTDLLVRE